VGDADLHVAEAGPKGAPLAIFLHGFPDHWISWRGALERAWRKPRHVIAPDGRGIGLSTGPDDVDAYALPRLASDVLAMADHAGAEIFDLIGHDWGGVVAWHVAQTSAARVRRLAIVNAPHPYLLGEALSVDPDQQRRSQYLSTLRSPHAEAQLTVNDFAALRAVHAELDHTPGFNGAAYLEIWRRPGSLTRALNWYRAAAFLDDGGASCQPASKLTTPTLMVWGEGDESFSPALIDAHHRIASRLSIHRAPKLGHWPHLEAPTEILARLAQWLDATDD
jgi:pimeloyl-ACP methyl ester carboxylesterase